MLWKDYEAEFGPMPKGAFWVPARMGGGAPSLEEAEREDKAVESERYRVRRLRDDLMGLKTRISEATSELVKDRLAITAKPASGEVEEVTLRVTRLRSADGVVWYIRNGEILRVGNTSQGTPVATIDVQVAARADSRTVVEVLTAAMEELAASPEGDRHLLGVPSVAGIQEVRNGAMTCLLYTSDAADE